MLHTLSVSLLPVLMIVAALSDVTSFRIPNWLTGLIAALFFPMALITGMPMIEFLWHLAAGLVLFCVGYALFAFRVFGGGDAKLMAAAGLWFGTAQTIPFLTMTAFAGGLLAVAIAGWSVFMLYWQVNGAAAGSALDKQLQKVRPKLPYGFAFAVGAILAFPDTWWTNVY
jgi:prepilin peptidase CpaA